MDRTIVLSTVSEEAVIEQIPKVTGRVTDTSGNPLPGVSVVLKRTTTETVTDVDGRFSLANLPDNAILVFSFVGMKSQEIAVEGKTSINVTMAEETIGIEEVVAIGYGFMPKKDLTGSVASVSGSTLKDIPVTSADQAIAGRLAGVQVMRAEGSPDAEIRIRVRGGGSITQDNSPLFIVDGFPVDNINDIAPTDIQSIDVLKDASSTAIYGARGANGVILITTKTGEFEGKGKVSYNTYFGAKQISKTLDVLDPYEFVLYQHEIQKVQNPSSTDIARRFGDFRDIGLYKETSGRDWQDEVLGLTGNSMYHNLAVSGGSKTTKYNISLTRNDENEIMLGSGYAKTSLTANFSQKVNKWLTIDLSPRFSDTSIKGAGTTSSTQPGAAQRLYRLNNIVQYRPVRGLVDFLDEDLIEGMTGYETTSYAEYNPVDMTKDDYRRTRRLNFYFNGAASVRLSKNLTYRLSGGIQYGENKYRNFYGLNTFNTYFTGRPMTDETSAESQSYQLANTLTYSKRDFLPGSNLTMLMGQEMTNYKTRSIKAEATYFPLYIDAESALAMPQLAGIFSTTASISTPVSVASFFGRLNYDYKSKYYLTATIRADGSSKFAPGNQWGYFPSVGLGWNVSEEKFMKNTESWLSHLKLRASYGEAGNNRISDNAWQKTFSVGLANIYMGTDQTAKTPVISPGTILSNKNLRWETTLTRNAGLDFSLFKSRISANFDAYFNTTEDLLISATLPPASGYSYQWQNIGETSNKGIEIQVDTRIVDSGDFKLSASFNIGMNKARIEKLGDIKEWRETSGVINPNNVDDYLIKEGGRVGDMYGWESEGMYTFDDFYYDAATAKYTLKEGIPNDKTTIAAIWFGPGTLKLKDQNGDGVINTADKVVLGNATPKHTGGFNLTAQYKGLDFSAFFNWVYGNDIYNANKNAFTSKWSDFNYRNLLTIMDSDHRFRTISKETGLMVTDPLELAEMNANATMWSPLYTTPVLFDWIVEDGSFLRLNTVTLGYIIPHHLTKKIGIDKIRVYASGYNLWIWTNYSGYDPEVNSVPGALTPGIDFSAYPRSRAVNVGLNVEF
jgi:TonB-linked SusC/RagA family outer membrane protein